MNCPRWPNLGILEEFAENGTISRKWAQRLYRHLQRRTYVTLGGQPLPPGQQGAPLPSLNCVQLQHSCPAYWPLCPGHQTARQALGYQETDKESVSMPHSHSESYTRWGWTLLGRLPLGPWASGDGNRCGEHNCLPVPTTPLLSCQLLCQVQGQITEVTRQMSARGHRPTPTRH